MTSKELIEKITSFEEVIRKHSYLLECIAILSDRYREYTVLRAQSAALTETHLILNAQTSSRDRLGNYVNEAKQFSPRKIFSESEAFSDEIELFGKRLTGGEKGILEEIANSLKAFSDYYEKLVLHYRVEDLLILLMAASKLDASIKSTRQILYLISRNLSDRNVDAGLQEGAISILLDSTTDYPTFLAKVNSIEIIYLELCELMKVSPQQNPLKILKIESGSLWAWVQGNPIVTTLLGTLISSAAHYLYRNYLSEGKLNSIPRKIETIGSILNLADELEKRGIATKEIKDSISKSSVIIANQLRDLLAGEKLVELNGEKIAITPVEQEKLIAQGKIILLKEKNDKEEQK